MARAGLNKHHIQQARDALRARGINPSVDAIRIELGNTGSKTTIHRYVKELEETESTRLDDEALLSGAIKEMVSRLAAKLREEALQIVEDANTVTQNEKKILLAQIGELQAKTETLSVTKTQLEHQLKTERADHQATQDNLIDFRLKTERLGQQVIQQTVQLTDHQQHLASLEEKHANARDALEHFRTAAKEQREQEQRRHEQQVQQLQAEMRTLNQTLIIKQTDITQLNRDNASFVGDIAELRKQLRSHEASSADWVIQINEAKTVLSRYQSALRDGGAAISA
jgi:chromosome segregation ATPase